MPVSEHGNESCWLLNYLENLFQLGCWPYERKAVCNLKIKACMYLDTEQRSDQKKKTVKSIKPPVYEAHYFWLDLHFWGLLSFIIGNRNNLSCHFRNLTIRWPARDVLLQRCIPVGNFRSFSLWEVDHITWGLQTISIIMDRSSPLPTPPATKQSHELFMAYGYHVKKIDLT